MKVDQLDTIVEMRKRRQAVATMTDLQTGESNLIDLNVDGALDPAVQALVNKGRSGILSIHNRDVFVTVYLPPIRLIVIGAVHITQSLITMAASLDVDITVIDPRTAFATDQRFAGVDLRAEWPQDCSDIMQLDPYTAVIALTHDPKIDDWPLMQALQSKCFYIGALGSRKTHQSRVERFKAAGLNEDEIARLDAPIGLDIGAANPAEIAISILASFIQALRLKG